MEFDDTNVSPEAAIRYHLSNDISIFAAYKEGFKSGGIDNSALPTASLNPLAAGFQGYDFLIYQSEEAKGFEVGLKGNLLNGSMRVNATAFSYEYSDLQVQLFDSTVVQFSTFNASALETEGVEFDLLWHTDIEGLSLRTAWAWTDTVYSEDFINATGQNLKGLDGTGSADVAGYFGATWDRAFGAGWRFSLSADARYTGDYSWSATLDPFIQDAFWVMDASISVYSSDNTHSFSLVGRNLNDEIYVVAGGAAPGRCPKATFGMSPACDNTGGANAQDQAATTPLGRTLLLEYRFTL